MQGNQEMLQALMGQLGLGMPKHTLGDTSYFGPLQRRPYQPDPRFMPSQQTQGMGMQQPMGMPQGAPMDPMAQLGMPQMPQPPQMQPGMDPMMGGGMDPAMMQMLGGLGLG